MRYIIALGDEPPYSALSRKEALAHVKPRVVHVDPPGVRLLGGKLRRRHRIRGRDHRWEPIWQELWVWTSRPKHPHIADQLMTYIADRKGLNTYFADHRDKFEDLHHFGALKKDLAAREKSEAGSGRGSRRGRGRSAHSDAALCGKYHSSAWIDADGELIPLDGLDSHNDYAHSIDTSTDYLLGDGWVRVSTGLDVEGDARNWRKNPAPWRRWIELVLVCAASNDIRPTGNLYVTQSNGRWKQWTVGAAIEHYGTRTQVNDYYSVLLGERPKGRGATVSLPGLLAAQQKGVRFEAHRVRDPVYLEVLTESWREWDAGSDRHAPCLELMDYWRPVPASTVPRAGQSYLAIDGGVLDQYDAGRFDSGDVMNEVVWLHDAPRRGRGNLAPTARTAITRKGGSAPAKKLVELGLVRGKVLDYGSGRGGDVEWLRSEGFKVSAYDPHHGPKTTPTGTYDTVLSTYVLNVLPPREQLAVIKAVRQRLARGGRAYLTARTDTCPAPSSGVQTCVASVAGGKVVASGSGFRTWEIR